MEPNKGSKELVGNQAGNLDRKGGGMGTVIANGCGSSAIIIKLLLCQYY